MFYRYYIERFCFKKRWYKSIFCVTFSGQTKTIMGENKNLIHFMIWKNKAFSIYGIKQKATYIVLSILYNLHWLIQFWLLSTSGTVWWFETSHESVYNSFKLTYLIPL